MKTLQVKILVSEVLNTLPVPYSMHVIDEVMHAIETNPQWLSRYNKLCDELGRHVVNSRCGYWIANVLDKLGEIQVPSRKNTLTESYSLLDTDAASLRKPTEDEAMRIMSDYYRENRTRLPAGVREHRAQIIALLMERMPAKDAFDCVLANPSEAA
jgi:hypothetical protein